MSGVYPAGANKHAFTTKHALSDLLIQSGCLTPLQKEYGLSETEISELGSGAGCPASAA